MKTYFFSLYNIYTYILYVTTKTLSNKFPSLELSQHVPSEWNSQVENNRGLMLVVSKGITRRNLNKHCGGGIPNHTIPYNELVSFYIAFHSIT